MIGNCLKYKYSTTKVWFRNVAETNKRQHILHFHWDNI